MLELKLGFITQKNGEMKHQTIKAGQLTQILENEIGKDLEFNLLTGEVEVKREPIDTFKVENFYVQLSEWGYEIKKTAATDALIFASQKNSYHPVVDDLKRIEKDESIQPIDLGQVATDYLGTDDRLFDAMFACWLIALVARAFKAGCKFDNCIVFQGKEGLRKSSLLKALAGNDEWVCDTWQDVKKQLLMAIGTCWIYELAELDYMTTKHHQGNLKGMFTSQIDQYPPPYARAMGKFPRPSVFAATCNRYDFLSDPSADHRRYWIIPLKQDPEKEEYIDVDKVKDDRDAILKAAIIAYRKGKKPFLPQKLQNESNRRNQNFLADHPFMDSLADWLKHRDAPFTTQGALIDSGLREKDRVTDLDLKKASECLLAMGYQRDEHQTGPRNNRKRYWRKR